MKLKHYLIPAVALLCASCQQATSQPYNHITSQPHTLITSQPYNLILITND